MEYCGRVAEIGADVSDLAVGDRVVGMANYGAFADELVTEQVYTRSLWVCDGRTAFVIAFKMLCNLFFTHLLLKSLPTIVFICSHFELFLVVLNLVSFLVHGKLRLSFTVKMHISMSGLWLKFDRYIGLKYS